MARYFPAGVSSIRWVPVVANKLAPTATEINGGTDLTPDIADMGGWTSETAYIGTPDLASRFESNVPGRKTTGGPTLTIYEDDAAGGSTKRVTLAEGTSGNIVLLPLVAAGVAVTAAKKAEVWPVKVASNNLTPMTENAAQRFITGYSVQSPPAQNVAVV